jgi:hypothetical protein
VSRLSVREDAIGFVGGLIALLMSVAFAYVHDAPLRAGVDHQHVSSVRELARGEFPPRHNLIAGRAPQGHYGPYFVVLGVLARWTGAAPRAVLYGAGLVGVIAFTAALGFVAWRLAGPSAAAWSPWCAALLWGPWPASRMEWTAWGWPGTTSPADAQNFYYPQHAALVLLLVIVALLLPREGEPPNVRRVLIAALLAGLLVATHPLTGIALAIALVALAAAQRIEGRIRTSSVVAIVMVPFVGLALAARWPYYPVLGLLRAFVEPGLRQYSALAAPAANAAGATLPAAPTLPAPAPTPVLSVLGPAVVGLGGVLLLARRRHSFLLIWTLLSFVAVFCPLLPLRQRLVTFLALPLQLGAAALAGHARLSPPAARLAFVRGLVAVLLCLGATSAVLRLRWVLSHERPDLSFVARFVPEDGIVLSDSRTSNAVAGLTSRKIVSPEGPDVFLVLAGGIQRSIDVERFLTATTSEAERRTILERWSVTHVLIDRLGAGGPQLPYQLVYEGGGFALYDVRGAPAAIK